MYAHNKSYNLLRVDTPNSGRGHNKLVPNKKLPLINGHNTCIYRKRLRNKNTILNMDKFYLLYVRPYFILSNCFHIRKMTKGSVMCSVVSCVHCVNTYLR
jgi:hypothetical protein